MDFDEVIMGRGSVRGYLDKPVPKELIDEIISMAKRCPSSMNSQPWHVHVLSGSVLDEVRRRNVEVMEAGGGSKRDVFPHPRYEGEHRRRQVDVAKKLFASMGIAREDKTMRHDWVLRGYRQFDAPVSIVLTYDRILEPGITPLFDLGALSFGIVLAATARGLGAVVNGTGINRSDIVREVAGIPEEEVITVCIALGYPDESFPANQVRSDREPNDVFVRYLGFE